MKAFLKHNGIYLLIYIGLLCFIGNILIHESKVQIHREMNAYVGNLTIDQFFAYATHLGDGIFAVLIAFLFLFKNVRVSLYILLSYAGAGIVSYVLKHWIYYEIYRPHFVFQYFVREQLKLVDGVDVVAFHSFPSGHALSAFALFFCLLFVSKNHVLKTGCFVLAILAAYSRVYLSQHWLIDVYVGSVIGVSFSLLFYILFYHSKKWAQLNSPLPKLLSQKNNIRV
ncbi:MAG: phosphatase PAP2 family protein [Bacteroidetes bacterium]|nr:phosphatase PAP2 family protein [Bacteroidota bacterium]